jgi:hypothetical protein
MEPFIASFHLESCLSLSMSRNEQICYNITLCKSKNAGTASRIWHVLAA